MYRIMFIAIFTAITIGCLAGNTRESKSIDAGDAAFYNRLWVGRLDVNV